MAQGGGGGTAAKESGKAALLRASGLLPLPVSPLGGLNGVVPLRYGEADILDIPEFYNDTVKLSAGGYGQKGGHQLVAVDHIVHVLKLEGLSGHHLLQMALKQLSLEKIPEVVSRHLNFGAGALAGIGGAAQQIADALPPGGVPLFLPEFHLSGDAA